MAAARSISRVFSPAILHRTRNFVTKIPDHKIWEEESASLRLRGPSPIGKPWPEYGVDYQHWLVQVKLPNWEMSREEIIDFYVNLLAAAVGGYLFYISLHYLPFKLFVSVDFVDFLNVM